MRYDPTIMIQQIHSRCSVVECKLTLSKSRHVAGEAVAVLVPQYDYATLGLIHNTLTTPV